MPERDLIEFAAGCGGAILAAPVLAFGLRRLFALFLIEGTDLFTPFRLRRADAMAAAGLVARLNVIVAVATWVLLLITRFLHETPGLQMAIALGGLVTGILATVFAVWLNLEFSGRRLWLVAIVAFAGGNLPLIVALGAALAIL